MPAEPAAAPHTAQVGDVLPTFERDTDLGSWNRFAAVNDEFVALHMDDESGRTAGYSGAIGMGNLQWAYVHNMLRAWLGDDGRIDRLAFELRGPNLKGQRVVAGGEITERELTQGALFLSVDVWTRSGDGDQLGRGTALVSIPTW